jgi:hypothetical protein
MVSYRIFSHTSVTKNDARIDIAGRADETETVRRACFITHSATAPGERPGH